jgi:hypothetical protein
MCKTACTDILPVCVIVSCNVCISLSVGRNSKSRSLARPERSGACVPYLVPCYRHQFGEVQAHRTSLNLHPHRDSKIYTVLLHEFGVVRLDQTFSDYILMGDTRSAPVQGGLCLSLSSLSLSASLLSRRC